MVDTTQQAMMVQQRFVASDKGIPSDLIGRPVMSLVGRNVRDGTFPSPVIVAYSDRIEHNLTLMKAWCDHHGVEIAPHAKTAMAPKWIRRQLGAGASGMTVATITQARTLHALGIDTILLANQLINPAGVDWAFDASVSGLDLTVFVDSIEGVAALEQQDPRGQVKVLVEVGGTDGRTGARSLEEALRIAESANATPGLTVVGVAGYEGVFLDDGMTDPRARVRAYLSHVADTFEELDVAGHFDELDTVVLSAGGSACFDDVTEILSGVSSSRPVRVVLRSGCYLTHDHGLYEGVSPLRNHSDWLPFEPAIELAAQVLSRPEPGLALLDTGRRDVSFDCGLPKPLGWFRSGSGPEDAPGHWRVFRIMDHHSYLAVDERDGLRVGDFVTLGISHPCTTLDKWRHIPEVSNDGTVLDVISTVF